MLRTTLHLTDIDGNSRQSEPGERAPEQTADMNSLYSFAITSARGFN